MMRNTLFVRFLSILIILPLSGCIAAIQGNEQKVSFTSNPEGALFNYYGKQCKAPCVLEIPRTGKYSMLIIEHDGYSPYSTEIFPKELEVHSFWLDPIVFFETITVVPIIIDLSIENHFDFPEEIHADYQAPLMAPKVDIKWKKK